MTATLICQDEQRRERVRKSNLNGLDYLEVSDCQTKLMVFFLGKAPSDLVSKSLAARIKHVRIEGGRRIRDVRVERIEFHLEKDPEADDWMEVTVNRPGDFSRYTLRLVAVDNAGRPLEQPYPGFDARYARLDFSFKAGCPSDLDCKPREVCPPSALIEPNINYLAKDYDSFRQLILDRLALLMPDWKERHEADLGITLVELLAYAGDYLSYYQDAVSTEAYLDTARQRISVRRHVQLVDYQLHEGCNARAWVFVELKGKEKEPFKSDEFYFITRFAGLRESDEPLTASDLSHIPASDYLVFEPLVEACGKRLAREKPGGAPLTFFEAHNRIPIYTWGNTQCCLAKGATSATLQDAWLDAAPAGGQQVQSPAQGQKGPASPQPGQDRRRRLQLQAGDFLLFEELQGPKTGNPADADPSHRHVVRLTKVTPVVDELGNAQDNQPVPVLEIEWDEADALPFPLCISTVGPPPKCELMENVSVARGNIVLADHGRTSSDEPLGVVPTQHTESICLDEGRASNAASSAGAFRPVLRHGPITFSQPLRRGASAAALTRQDARTALPCVRLRSTPVSRDGRLWYGLSEMEDPTRLIADLRTFLHDKKTETDRAVHALAGRFSTHLRQLVRGDAKDDPITDATKRQVSNQLRYLTTEWEPRPSLLDSRGLDAHFVIEVDNDGRARLRFGDGELGWQPQAGAEFGARYRVGSGPQGNVGAGSIQQIVLRDKVDSGISLKPRNPLPAHGGMAAESLAEAKQFAPHAFRRELQRAITPADYVEIVERDFAEKVQRAAAALRWRGSYYEVLLAIDPFDRFSDDAHLTGLLRQIYEHLHRYRRIGHDLRVEAARRVPLDIALTVCVHRDYLPGDVKEALFAVFSNRVNADGRLGYFHPDNLSFGDDIHLSGLVAAAQAIEGVENVLVTKLERLFEGKAGEIENGVLPLGRLEIVRLDNDPNFPEYGQLALNVQGER